MATVDSELQKNKWSAVHSKSYTWWYFSLQSNSFWGHVHSDGAKKREGSLGSALPHTQKEELSWLLPA